MEITPIQSSAPRALSTTVVDNIAGLHSITLAYKRRGAGYTDFACLHMKTEEGTAPKHNQSPTATPDEITSTCLQQAQERADEMGYPTHVRASFKLSHSGNGRPRKNPTPVTWPVAVDGSDPLEEADPQERDRVYTLLRDIAKENNDHTIKLVDKVCTLVDNLGSVGKVLEGAATFYSEGHRVYREGVDATADQAFTQATLDAEVKKWEAIAQSLGPGAMLLVKQIHASMGGGGGPVQTGSIQTAGPSRQLPPAPAFTPAQPAPANTRGAAIIVAELVTSLSADQHKELPDNKELAAFFASHTQGDDAVIAAFTAFVAATPGLVLGKVYETLEPAQVGLLTELQDSVL